MYNDNKRQTFWYIKTLQSNIAVNGVHNTKLCESNAV